MANVFKKTICWGLGLIKRRGITFAAGIVFAVACFVGINYAMEGVSSSEYCGSKCHEMNEVYKSWELSPHGTNSKGFRVECVDCHLPPKDKYFTHLYEKAYAGAKDTFKHHFGPEYDGEKMSEHVLANFPDERCKHCHDDLLGKGANSAARMVHKTVLSEPDNPEYRCIKCHEDVGHEKSRKIFAP